MNSPHQMRMPRMPGSGLDSQPTYLDPTLSALDNLETLLANEAAVQPVLQLATDLLASDNKTRLLSTTRETHPAPFDQQMQECHLGALTVEDAKALVMRVMANAGLDLKHDDDGRTPEEVDALVNAVNGHAHALVLLAQELSNQGVTATTQNLQRIMQQLERKHPGERELSLFASVELSLQRLSVETRELINGLAVLHDGANLSTIIQILRVDQKTAAQLTVELIQVGLAEQKAYSYLRLDPALPNYLDLQLQADEKQRFQQRWLIEISELIDFLFQHLFKNAKLATQLTQLELPNLMAFIRELNRLMQMEEVEPKTVANKAGRIEQLLAILNYPQALAETISIRQQAAKQLIQWSHTSFAIKRLTIERLMNEDALQQALEAAQELLQQCRKIGTEAYQGAENDFELAMSNRLLGQVLYQSGAAAEALNYLQQAQQGFEGLGEQAVHMASVSLTGQGNCLLVLGRLDEAATAWRPFLRGNYLAPNRHRVSKTRTFRRS